MRRKLAMKRGAEWMPGELLIRTTRGDDRKVACSVRILGMTGRDVLMRVPPMHVRLKDGERVRKLLFSDSAMMRSLTSSDKPPDVRLRVRECMMPVIATEYDVTQSRLRVESCGAAIYGTTSERQRRLYRYLVFAFDSYYPDGGWRDFQGSFRSKRAAVAHARTLRYDHKEVIDITTGREVGPVDL
jgi:hypothetical protein